MRVRQEEAVEIRRTIGVPEADRHLAEDAEAEDPFAVPRQPGETIVGQLLELEPRGIRMRELALEQREETAERAVAGSLVDRLAHQLLELVEAPALGARRTV